jgi:hypothetical protein
MYPSAAKPAAITSRKTMGQVSLRMKDWLIASNANPSAMVKYHQAKKRGFRGVGNNTRERVIREGSLQQFAKLFQCEAGVANDATHCVGVHGMIAG